MTIALASAPPIFSFSKNPSILLSPEYDKNENKNTKNYRIINKLNNPTEFIDILRDVVTSAHRTFALHDTLWCPKCESKTGFNSEGKESAQVKCRACGKKISIIQIIKQAKEEHKELILGNFTDPKLCSLARAKLSQDSFSKAVPKLFIDLKEELEDSRGNPKKRAYLNVEDKVPIQFGNSNEKKIQAKIKQLEEALSFERAGRVAAEKEVEALKMLIQKSAKQEAQPVKKFQSSGSTIAATTTALPISFADATALTQPKPKSKPIKVSYSALPKLSNEEIQKLIEPVAPSVPKNLEILFFQGCPRKNISEYRRLLESQGVRHYTARDMTFLSDDILQITAYSESATVIVKALESASQRIKHMKHFDPTVATSYGRYNTMSNEATKKAYFALVKSIIERLEKQAKANPSLEKPCNFLKKVLATENIKYQPAFTRQRILNCFFAPAQHTSPMDVESKTQVPGPTLC
jgi:hypothetical protein